MDLPNKSDIPPVNPVRKPLKPVIPGATQVKRPATRRMMDYVFAESLKGIAARIGRDVVVPRLKAVVEEASNGVLHGLLWGGGAPPSSLIQGTTLRGPMGTPYHNITGMQTPATMAAMANQSRPPGQYQDLCMATQQHAEVLLANLLDLFNQYRVVTIADLYEIANMTPKPGDDRMGWTNLDSARIAKDRNGYLLELPRPTLI